MSPSPRRQSKLRVNLGEIFFVNLKSNLTSNIYKKPKQFLRRSRIWADSCRRRNAQVIQGKSHSFGRSPAALAGGKGYTCLCTYQWFAPGWGGPGNPRELDFVKPAWVGILTSTTVPRVGNSTRTLFYFYLNTVNLSDKIITIKNYNLL